MPAREVVVRLQLEDRDALPKFQALKKEQVELNIGLAATRKSIRENEKAYQALLNTQIDSVQQEQQVEAQIKKNREQFNLLTKTLGGQELKYALVSAQTRELKNDLSGVTDAGLRFRDILAQAANNSPVLRQRLDQLDQKLKEGKIDATQYTSELKAIADQQKQTAQATITLTQRFDQFASQQKQELTSTLKGVALQYIGVGAAIYGVQRVIGSAIRTVVDFDQALANVAALGGEYKDRIEELGDAARTLGPKFGVGASKALESVEALAKAGVSAADILSGGLESALTLAAAGELEAGQAAEFVASTLVQFQLEGKNATHVADLLAAAANKAQGDVNDFGQALKFVGPVAASMGITLEETVGTLADFANNGILGEQAGTSLRGVLAALTSPSKLASEELRNLGVVAEDGANKLFDAQGKFKGLANLAGVLQDATKDLTQEERANSLGRIFGNQQLTAANILIKEGAAGIADFTAKVNDQGIASRVAQDKLDSAAGAASKLAANWERFVTAVLSSKSAQAIIESISEFVEATAEAIERYGEVDVFTKKIDLFYKSLTNGRKGVEQITANSDVIDRYRQIVDSVEAETDATIKLGRATDLRAKALARVHELEKLDLSDANADSERIVTELAVARATAATANEIVNSLATKAEASKADAAATETNEQKQAKLIVTLGALRAELASLKEARDAINIADTKALAANKAAIDAVEKQIKALEGEGSAANNAKGSIAALQAQIQEFQKQQAQSTTSEQFATFQAQIDKLEESIKRIKETSATPLIDEVFGNLEALPPELTDPGTPLIDELVAEDLQRLAELQEQARINEIIGIKDFNLERQILQAEYDAGVITSREELNARLQAIDQEQVRVELQRQQEALATASSFFSALQNISDTAFDSKIARVSEDEAALQEQLSEARTDAEKARLEDAIKAKKQEKKDLEERKKSFQLFAIAAALIDTFLAANNALAAQPFTLANFAQAALAIVTGLANVQKIKGFDTGGEVDNAPQRRGTVTSAWGRPIRRSNGDDRLVTLKTGEKVLNEDQQEELERLAGKGIWGRIGLPGHASYAGIEAFLRDQHQPRAGRTQGLFTGGTVGQFIPRPSAAELSAERQVAELRAIEFAPEVSVVEIDRVQNRVRVNESLRTS